MDLAQWLGWVATILFSLMIVPQMVKTIKTKNTEGVSFLLFVIYLTANIIALVYAFLIKQQPLIFKYSIGIITTLVYICLFFYYNKKKA